MAWIAGFYFAEGFPFGIVVDNLPVYFRVHGVSLAAIGMLSPRGRCHARGCHSCSQARTLGDLRQGHAPSSASDPRQGSPPHSDLSRLAG